MLNDSPLRPIDAIRHGFDDRLLAFVEYEPGTSVTLETAAECLHTWRALFEDDLEVVAFVRIGSTPSSTNAHTNGTDEQCAAVRALSTRNLPVAVAVVESVESDDNDDTAGHREQWTLCENDFRSLLVAIRVPADLLFCRFDRLRARRAPTLQPFVGLGPAASYAEQIAFVTEFANGVALRGDTPLGVVLTAFRTSDASTSRGAQRLLNTLADAVYRRRIRCAA